MAGKISAKDIEAVKARTNIADVVGEYVALRTGGVGSLKGLCPFHDEKSPSFNVRPSQGFYHCFGCGEGGDVYKFVQRLDNLSFAEAVEKVASKIGFTLTYEEGGADPAYGQRARIFEANTAASAYFESQLSSDGAAVGRNFLTGRGFDQVAAKTFGIGYAPQGWRNLSDHLLGQGFTAEELVTAGLASMGDKGAYDKFRGRLIWPIRDSTAQVIGFGARKLFDDDNGPKYLNTSDTAVYHKSQVLYGIDLAKRDIAKTQKVVVVEGYTDVMACHLAGITTAVATCGTAFGDDHIRTLNRLLSSQQDAPAEVIFTFDPDAAGQKAAMRAFADSHKFGAATFVAIGPDGLDPCDLRSQRGDEAVVAMINSRRPLFEFAIKQKLGNFDLDSLEGRVSAARSAALIVAGITDTSVQSAYIRELAGWTNLDSNEVAGFVRNAAKTSRSDSVAGMRLSEPVVSDSGTESEPEFASVNLADPTNRMERTTLEVLLQVPQALPFAVLERIVTAGFAAPAHAAIGRAIAGSFGADGAILSQSQSDYLRQVAALLPDELQDLLREIAATALPASNEAGLAAYAEGVLIRALDNVLNHEKNALLAQLRRLDPSVDLAAYRDVQGKLMAIEAQRRSLRQ